MPELDIVESELVAGTEAVEHTSKVFNTALDVLTKFKDSPLELASISYGSKELTRSGMKRQVNFLEVGDGSGTNLVIEVYTKTGQ